MKVRWTMIVGVTSLLTATVAVAQSPTGKVKSKMDMMDAELEQASGGMISNAKKKSDAKLERLKKERSYEALQRKAAKEAARRRAAKKKAAERARRDAAREEAEAAPAQGAAVPSKAPAASPADLERVKTQAQQRRKDRSRRRAAQRKAVPTPPVKANAAAFFAELEQHARRLARLRRVQEVAAEVGDSAAVVRASAVLKIEASRHARALQTLEGSAP